METMQLIKEMLTENTGKHFLDSGGDSNRNWQKNQGINFENQPCVEFDIYGNGIDITINLYPYLKSANLELDHICNTFNDLQDKYDNWDATGELTECYGVSLQAWRYLEDNFDDIKIINTWNTYNGDSFLSQVLQGSYLEINEESYVLFQIHGGADVRGGYTNAKLFKLDQFQEYLPCETVYGEIDGIQVDTSYDGYNLTDENGNEVEIKENSKIDLYLMEM